MSVVILQPDESVSLFVKSIQVFEEQEKSDKTVLPFFADGYPGLIFHDTEHGLTVSPHNKEMSALFLYGQTIQPVELVLNGAYRLVIFQLYPFVLKSFFGVDAAAVNDNCYDLLQTADGQATLRQLQDTADTPGRMAIITRFLSRVFEAKKETLDFKIRQAIQVILDGGGQVQIKALCEMIKITERTFVRRFTKETGITPKQFSQIIRFQQSLEQLEAKAFTRLSDIVYHNGFADQSHFIRVFKAFTGKTPKAFS